MVKRKLQSAMEYLMTYGWAILIIAVVMVALFSLGVFNTSPLGSSCVALSGYLCSAPVLTPLNLQAAGTGNLTFTWGQNTGATMFNVIIAVAPQGSGVNGFGYPTTLSNTMSGPLAARPNFNTVLSGQSIPINITLSSTVLPSNALNTQFSGSVWVNYSSVSLTSKSVSSARVGTIIVKVT